MSIHSVAAAKNRLSQLIDRALKGQEVVSTCHGHPVVVLKPVGKPAHAVSAADLDWLAEHPIERAAPSQDAGTLLTNLGNEDER
jgi:prevent-host-death family protein